VNFLTQALAAIAAIFGWKKQREAAQNSPEMQANAAAATKAEVKAAATAAVAKDHLAEIRKQLAE
jgi:hypothetical protein